MNKRVSRICLVPWVITLIAAVASAQTKYKETIPAGNGTLSYTVTVLTEKCEWEPNQYWTYYQSTYNGFSYTVSGQTTPLTGTDQTLDDPGGAARGCAATSMPAVLLVGLYTEINFTPSGTTGGSAMVLPGITGFVNPKYVVVGVTYAPPGPNSSVTYSGSTLLGNTTTLTSSFQTDVSVAVSVSSDISAWTVVGGAGEKITNTASTDVTQGTNSSETVTTSKTSTVSYQTKGTLNACAPVDHDYDQIWLWVNPLLIYTVYPGTTNIEWNGYGYDNHDPSGTYGRDVVAIQVGWLNGHFGSDPAINAILARGWVTQYEPGMIWPAGEGPGITSADISNILAADPFTNPSYVLPTPPPITTSDGRFTQEPYPPNPVNYIESGLTTSYNTVNVNTQAYSNGTNYTLKQAFGTEESFSGGSWLGSLTVDIKTTDTLTWSYSWLNTLTVTQTNTKALSVTEPSGCPNPQPPGEFIVFQDNHFGTFMFYPETN